MGVDDEVDLDSEFYSDGGAGRESSGRFSSRSNYERQWRSSSRAEQRLEGVQKEQHDDLVLQMTNHLDKLLGGRPEAPEVELALTEQDKELLDRHGQGHWGTVLGRTEKQGCSLHDQMEQLQAKFADVKRWNLVFKEITSNPELCSSRPLATLLERIRTDITSYFASFEFMFIEVRRRMELDWLTTKMEKQINDDTEAKRERVNQLEEELTKEIELSKQFEQALQSTKDSLASTSRLFEGEKVAPTKEYDEATGTLRPCEDATEEEEQEDHNETWLMRHEKLKKRALVQQTSKPKIKIVELHTGQVVCGFANMQSHYYRFVLDQDDIGIFLGLTQKLPAGDDTNYLELSVAKGKPPRKKEYTHFTTTRNSQSCVLETAMEAGEWYARVRGRGFRLKEFNLDFRVKTRLKDFSGQLGDLVDDIDMQMGWQGAVTEKMVIIDDMVTTLLPKAQKDYHTLINTVGFACQTSPDDFPVVVKAKLRVQREPQSPSPIHSLLSLEHGECKKAEKKVMLKRDVMRLIGQIFADYVLLAQSSSEAFPKFVYKHFLGQCQGETKKAEQLLYRLLSNIEKKFLKYPRCRAFSRFLGVSGPVLHSKELQVYTEAHLALRKCTLHHPLVDNEDNHMLTAFDIAAKVVEDIFKDKPTEWRLNVLARIERSCVVSEKELKKDKDFKQVAWVMVDVDAFLLLVSETGVEDKQPEYMRIRSVFKIFDYEDSGFLDLERFLAAVQYTSPWFTSLELMLIFRDATILSQTKSKKKTVTMVGWALVAFQYGFLTEPEQQPAPAEEEQADPKSQHANLDLPYHRTKLSSVPFPDTHFDILVRSTNVLNEIERVLRPEVLSWQPGDPSEATAFDGEGNYITLDFALLTVQLNRLEVTPPPSLRSEHERLIFSCRALIATWDALSPLVSLEVNELYRDNVPRSGRLNKELTTVNTRIEQLVQDSDSRDDLNLIVSSWELLVELIETLVQLLHRPYKPKSLYERTGNGAFNQLMLGVQ